MKNFILFIWSCCMWSACCNDCSREADINFGKVLLSPQTKPFLALTGSEKLIFKDSTGAEMVFRATSLKSCSTQQHSIATLCQGNGLLCRSPHALIDAEICSLIFKADKDSTLRIQYELRVEGRDTATINPTPDTAKLFFDALNIYPLGGLFIVDRGGLNKDIGFKALKTINVADTTIQNKRFSNIMQSSFSNQTTTWWYSKDKGIVCFKDFKTQTQWVLDRIE